MNDLAALEPEYINDGGSAGAGLSYGMYVQDHIVAVDEHSFNLAVGIGELFAQVPDKPLQSLRAVSSHLVVLDILRTEVFRGGLKILPDAFEFVLVAMAEVA